ncbi:NEDD4-binding protein 2-like 2 [Trachinotus anak]|uniref:NEDD4-binding protein 2-like 2 n=1 Tax=Trachinotus anak TaxID=443729 RepID=UPI0039F231C1
MSHTESSCTTSPDVESPCVGVGERTEGGRDDSADKNTKCVNSDWLSSDSSVRERVLKEVGLTSTTFIGPSFPPEIAAIKSDIEDTLSDFYKELEKVDTPNVANGNPGKQDGGLVQPPSPQKTSTSKQAEDVRREESDNMSKSEETDSSRKSSGQKQPSWPHWYQNKPYYPRRPRPGMDLSSGRAVQTQNQWYYPQPVNGPPTPRLYTPPSAFPNPQNPPPPHMNPSWSGSGMANKNPESHFPTFSSFPSPTVYFPPTQGFYRDYPHHLDRDERGSRCNTYSDNVNIGWSRDREEEWSQFDEEHDRHQRFVSENELWERQHHCRPPDNTHKSHSSLVLILMRGLPGSGKSTLARELLSTGPNGLILSTDDYFAHKDGYCYEPGLLGVAHEWNQSRAKDAMHDHLSPVIIDNTNIQAWEMKPYVKMALERGYKVDFCEPDTSWKLDPYELQKRNKHGVSQEKIAQMMDRFSFPISIDIVMSSQEPPHVNRRHRPEKAQKMRRNRDFH